MQKIVCDLCGSTIQGRRAEDFAGHNVLPRIDAEIDLGTILVRYDCGIRNDKGEMRGHADVCPNCIRRAFGAYDEANSVIAAEPLGGGTRPTGANNEANL
jgi:hypothetical protein